MAWQLLEQLRRRGSPEVGERPAPAMVERQPLNAWRDLSPIQRTIGSNPTTIDTADFSSGLSAHRAPLFLAPLGHDLRAGAPSGLVRALATATAPAPVQRAGSSGGLAMLHEAHGRTTRPGPRQVPTAQTRLGADAGIAATSIGSETDTSGPTPTLGPRFAVVRIHDRASATSPVIAVQPAQRSPSLVSAHSAGLPTVAFMRTTIDDHRSAEPTDQAPASAPSAEEVDQGRPAEGGDIDTGGGIEHAPPDVDGETGSAVGEPTSTTPLLGNQPITTQRLPDTPTPTTRDRRPDTDTPAPATRDRTPTTPTPHTEPANTTPLLGHQPITTTQQLPDTTTPTTRDQTPTTPTPTPAHRARQHHTTPRPPTHHHHPTTPRHHHTNHPRPDTNPHPHPTPSPPAPHHSSATNPSPPPNNSPTPPHQPPETRHQPHPHPTPRPTCPDDSGWALPSDALVRTTSLTPS